MTHQFTPATLVCHPQQSVMGWKKSDIHRVINRIYLSVSNLYLSTMGPAHSHKNYHQALQGPRQLVHGSPLSPTTYLKTADTTTAD